MLIVLPYQVQDPSDRRVIPVANGMLIVANVLVFWLGWSAYWAVGPGTGVLSIVTYAFAHANVGHLVGNMWFLMLFGSPLNRRLGNSRYLALYFGAAVAVGLLFKLMDSGSAMGASGAISAVMAVFVILMPALPVKVFYFALFPISLLIGLFHRPSEWVHWFIRWDTFCCRAVWGIFLIPFLEMWGLYWQAWNWTNAGHLFGVICGVVGVLMLPDSITMRRRSACQSYA